MDEKYISLKDASERLKIARPTLHHYIDVLKLEKKRFPLDRQAYLKMSDFEQIKTLREQMAERNNPAA